MCTPSAILETLTNITPLLEDVSRRKSIEVSPHAGSLGRSYLIRVESPEFIALDTLRCRNEDLSTAGLPFLQGCPLV